MKLRLKSLMTRRILAPLAGGLAALLCAEPLPTPAFPLDPIPSISAGQTAAADQDDTFVPGGDEDMRRVSGVHADRAEGYTLHAGRRERIPATRGP